MFLHAARLAFRALVRRPGFSALAIATIALGAGTNAAVSAVAYGVLLKPLPFADPDRLVAVWPRRFMSQVELRFLRERADGLSQIAAVAPGWTFSLTGAGEASKITVDRVSGNFFTTLGTPPHLGRVIQPAEEVPGAPKVLALSYRYWRSRFGGDLSIIGRTVKLDDVPHEIVSVMPASFEVLTTRVDAWAPLPADRTAFYDRLSFSLLVGRLARGVTPEAADARFKALIPVMRDELAYPASFGRTARLENLRTSVAGDLRTSLLVLVAAVTLMLLIAGANLGTLLVAQAAARSREFALHAAIGASRAAIVRLQLFDGLLVAAAGAASGLALAWLGMPLLLALLPRDTPRTGDIHIDATVALTVVTAALLVALVFAIAPSLSGGRRIVASLREGASTESRSARRMRGAMVSVQIALALVLTIGAGLMVRTLLRLQRVDPGMDVEHVLTMRLQPTSVKYRAPAAVVAYYDQVLERVRALPGVRAAGAIQHLPFSGINWVNPYDVEGQPLAPGETRPSAGYKIVAGDYFDAVGQPLLAGRTFTAADRSASPTGLILNETFARRHFGSAAAAIGRRLRTGRGADGWRPVVGVVGDVHTAALNEPVASEFYEVATGSGMPALMIAVRTSSDPLALAGPVREAISSIDSGVPVADLQPLETMVGASMAQPRLLLSLLGSFATAGLALGAVGVYGVVAFGVTRRRREIGIRMALGASRPSVIRLMLRESATYAAMGLAAGLGLAVAASRSMKGLLFEVSPTDTATYVLLAAGVAMLVAAASYLPARRAASRNPIESLRA